MNYSSVVLCSGYNQMKISPPSRSLSKSTLLITPLFLCIVALLSTVSSISYLFILQFSENVASDADAANFRAGTMWGTAAGNRSLNSVWRHEAA